MTPGVDPGSTPERLTSAQGGGREADDTAWERRRALLVLLVDDVVQGLAVTKYALEAGDHEYAHAVLDGALGSARAIINELLEDTAEGASLGPGDLVRLDPAVVVARRK